MPIDRSKWYNMWGNLIAGIKPYKNPNNWPRTSIVDDWDGIIQSLNCGSFINYGTLEVLKPANDVSSSVLYISGNGGSYPTQKINSTGVTGLVASLQSGFFLAGDGRVTYTISGTPSISGTASFAIQVGGKSCTLHRVVEQLVAPSNALILKAQLLNGNIINGRVGTSTGYYRILYWDGTHEIISNAGTSYNGQNNFQKTCTTSPDGTMASYGPKTIKIWSCDQNGNVSGDITDLKLTNDKYHEFVLDNITKIKHLSINNNSVITQSNLNFSLLTDIETITLNNLQAFTGEMSLPNIPNWLQPNFANSDGTFTSDRSQWIGLGYIYKVFYIENLPITSLNLGTNAGIMNLHVIGCTNVTNINNTGCTNLVAIELRNNTALVSSNLQLTYLDSISITNLPNYSSGITNLFFPNNLKQLFIDNIGSGQAGSVTTISLANLTSLKDLLIKNMPQINDVAITSLHNNSNLMNSLQNIYLTNVTCPYIDLTSFGELTTVELENLPNATLSLPYSVNYIYMSNLPGVVPADVDTLITGINTSGLTNGTIVRHKVSQTDLLRTNASDTALANIISKGWQLQGLSVSDL